MSKITRYTTDEIVQLHSAGFTEYVLYSDHIAIVQQLQAAHAEEIQRRIEEVGGTTENAIPSWHGTRLRPHHSSPGERMIVDSQPVATEQV